MNNKFWLLAWCPLTKNGFYDSRHKFRFKERKPSKSETPPGCHWIRVRVEEVTTHQSFMSEVCSVCNWTNEGCLNVGDHGKPKWICHGCIKRSLDTFQSKLTEMEQCLQWCSENVGWIQEDDGHGWNVGAKGRHEIHHAPTLYAALKSAWEARDK